MSRLDESRALAARALISSAERIAAMLPGAVLLIAGDGDCFSELSEKAKAVNARLGREAVVLAGARTDVASFVAAGDYFVGVSRAALEAMSAAKPVIVAGNEGYLGIFTPDRLSEAVETNFCCRGCPETTEDRLTDDLEKYHEAIWRELLQQNSLISISYPSSHSSHKYCQIFQRKYPRYPLLSGYSLFLLTAYWCHLESLSGH